MEVEGGTVGVEPRPYPGSGIVRGDITDCHTSDVGHWLAMTGIMEVRCMSAGRRGRRPLRKGQQEVRCMGILRIATPACGLVRNDRGLGGAAVVGGGVWAPRPTGA